MKTFKWLRALHQVLVLKLMNEPMHIFFSCAQCIELLVLEFHKSYFSTFIQYLMLFWIQKLVGRHKSTRRKMHIV